MSTRKKILMLCAVSLCHVYGLAGSQTVSKQMCLTDDKDQARCKLAMNILKLTCSIPNVVAVLITKYVAIIAKCNQAIRCENDPVRLVQCSPDYLVIQTSHYGGIRIYGTYIKTPEIYIYNTAVTFIQYPVFNPVELAYARPTKIRSLPDNKLAIIYTKVADACEIRHQNADKDTLGIYDIASNIFTLINFPDQPPREETLTGLAAMEMLSPTVLAVAHPFCSTKLFDISAQRYIGPLTSDFLPLPPSLLRTRIVDTHPLRTTNGFSNEVETIDPTGKHVRSVRTAIVLHGSNIVAYSCYGDGDYTIRLWDAAAKKCIQYLTGHKAAVGALALINPHMIASGDAGGKIKLWSTKDYTCCATWQAHSEWIHDIIPMLDRDSLSATSLASCSGDKSVKIWRLSDCLD